MAKGSLIKLLLCLVFVIATVGMAAAIEPKLVAPMAADGASASSAGTNGTAALVAADEVKSVNIKEADGTSGQNTNTGSGIKTNHIQNKAVTGAKIAVGAVTTGKIAAGAVIPDKISFYGNVAIVAPSGGDYDNPATAMSYYSNWCGTPSATNPCLLKIMPGIYTIGTSTVMMQNYIDIEGSGENVTVIQGNDDYYSGVVWGASNAEIRFLTVKNTGGGGGVGAIAIHNFNASPKLIHVTATSSASSGNNFGVFNDESSPTMTDVTASASGGSGNVGVNNYNSSSPTMTDVTASASGGSGSNNWGVFMSSSSPTMTNVIASASGGSFNYGVGINSSSPTMTNVTASASGGSTSYGVFTGGNGTVKINHSVIKGTTYAIYNGSGVTILVGNTQLAGGKASNFGTLICAGVYDENYTFYANTCP